jgi:methyl-CpG-binding domain protein 4
VSFLQFDILHSLAVLSESVADDPWKLLISVTLLNKTSGKLAIPVFWDILNKWPTPLALSQGVTINIIIVARNS